MNGFLKNLMYFAVTMLMLTVPILLTLPFCLGWSEGIQAVLIVAWAIDFIAVSMLVTTFAEASE